MIPEFNEDGYLPPGIYEASFEEVKNRFGFSWKRQKLLQGMSFLLEQCRILHCDILYLDGSFVTKKLNPNDYDACWDTTAENREQVLNNVLESLLESNSEVQKEYFGGEIYSAFSKAILLPELTILEYFQKTKQYEDKGIVMIKL
ncbi:hypothetical protein K8P02_16655 [Bacteroides nordii]|uniref:DUF6932 family protein n=1 Tax=Bacteroides TaxID=816 RepID=UPI00035F7F58|nr:MULTISPECIES: hypothetical protein [Bacteroides]EOA60575.1 hypothetical protein HMPREF1214_00149 [Bacteroides sp. HPS0048]UAK41782.1 hypothetical protein K8P02_16655 [Bacteroides nordii]